MGWLYVHRQEQPREDVIASLDDGQYLQFRILRSALAWAACRK